MAHRRSARSCAPRRASRCARPSHASSPRTTCSVCVSRRVAVVVDLRHPAAATFLDPAKLGWLRDAAAMADRLLLPTMRSLFDADYLPPAGGGGRFYLKLGSMPAAFQSFT